MLISVRLASYQRLEFMRLAFGDGPAAIDGEDLAGDEFGIGGQEQ